MPNQEDTLKGSAPVQGDLWSARARDWMEVQEAQHLPLFHAVLNKIGVEQGKQSLDVGCGAGLYCAMVAERGGNATGMDAAPALIAMARGRMPRCDFQVGEMEALTYAENSFDNITGFNSFQYAANPANALREARRVARIGARVVITTWGKPEACETADYLAALRPLLPPSPPGAPGPFALSVEGALESLATQSGWIPVEAVEVDCPFVYPDLPTALRGLLSAGPAVRAIRHSGEGPVREAVSNALAKYQTVAGEYHMANTFRFLIAKVA